MAKPKGSKLVICRNKHANFLLPGTERQCNDPSCRRMVKLAKPRKRGA